MQRPDGRSQPAFGTGFRSASRLPRGMPGIPVKASGFAQGEVVFDPPVAPRWWRLELIGAAFEPWVAAGVVAALPGAPGGKAVAPCLFCCSMAFSKPCRLSERVVL